MILCEALCCGVRRFNVDDTVDTDDAVSRSNEVNLSKVLTCVFEVFDDSIVKCICY